MKQEKQEKTSLPTTWILKKKTNFTRNFLNYSLCQSKQRNIISLVLALQYQRYCWIMLDYTSKIFQVFLTQMKIITHLCVLEKISNKHIPVFLIFKKLRSRQEKHA